MTVDVKLPSKTNEGVVVVGAGLAGLFAALKLSAAIAARRSA